ncbi:MAG: bis(5'-nucleosyl)-tetraphosphatase (symmetrical) YqeK [Candidatus Eremiobacteraeota bacterium]|nr:bis(5'-nucleosyl)-tetraphosphatase (symmetrical) YqeK [Candidatus Eremiobacteraeota bacterium]
MTAEALDFATVSKRVRGDLAQRHRYAHCVRVARLASRLARIHGEDPHRAMLAGMLHDLARLYSAEKLLAESARCGVPVDEYASKNPIVLHAPLGAALARERFGVTDRDVLSAIAKHTLAAAEMSLLDTIIFLADGLEPGRVFEARDRLVRLAERDLSAALRGTLAAHMAHLHEQGIRPSPQTAEAADAFLARHDLEATPG